MIDVDQKDKQRLLDVGNQEWTPFFEKINDLMLEEKKCRQQNDTIKGAEVCVKIVSKLFNQLSDGSSWFLRKIDLG